YEGLTHPCRASMVCGHRFPGVSLTGGSTGRGRTNGASAMELTRARFLSLLGAGAAGAFLGGCAKSPPPIDVTEPGFGRDASGTVSMWCRGGIQRSAQLLIDLFHAAQDRIRVDLTPVQDGQYVTKLATAIRGGRMPDLVDIDDINSALFIHRGVFADLTPLIEELPFRDQLSPGHL